MTNIEKINATTLEDVFYHILSRVIDISSFTEKVYMIDEDESMSYYDRVIINSKLVKPTLERLNEELAEYKSELLVVENARLAEVARVQAITDRWNAIPNHRGAYHEAKVLVSNLKLDLKRIIKENDTSTLDLLEDKSVIYQGKESVDRSRELRKKKGSGARKICTEILDIIAGYNIENSLSTAQKDGLEASYGPIVQALTINRPMKAKPLLVAVPVDGTIVTQEMKDEILEVYSKNGL